MLKNITRNFSLSSFKPSLLPKSVRIVEVGLRDGLQNEKTNGENKPIDVNIKTELLHLLSKTGLKNIEAGSFVSPKAVPQMANSNEVFEYINKNFNKQTSPIVFSALTPNIKGLEQAMQLGVEEVAIFGAASEGFSQKNINCSISESLKRFEAIFQFMNDNNYHPKVRGYVSCVLVSSSFIISLFFFSLSFSLTYIFLTFFLKIFRVVLMKVKLLLLRKFMKLVKLY